MQGWMQCRYLTRVDACVKALKEASGGGPISLLAHSAGGWLARVYLLGFGTAGIDRLVTLGSPHQPPPKVGSTRPDSVRARSAASGVVGWRSGATDLGLPPITPIRAVSEWGLRSRPEPYTSGYPS